MDGITTPIGIAQMTRGRTFPGIPEILSALTLREAERYFAGLHGGGRRVVGIYLGWNGDPAMRWLARALPYPRGFWNRYRVARRMAQAERSATRSGWW